MKLSNARHGSARELASIIADECLGMRLRLVDRAVTKIYNDALRPHGLRGTQVSILVVIALLGPVGPDRISHLLSMSPSSLSRTLERMKHKGWLSFSPGADARRLSMILTPAGRKILDQAREGWESAQKKVTSLLGADGVAAV